MIKLKCRRRYLFYGYFILIINTCFIFNSDYEKNRFIFIQAVKVKLKARKKHEWQFEGKSERHRTCLKINGDVLILNIWFY